MLVFDCACAVPHCLASTKFSESSCVSNFTNINGVTVATLTISIIHCTCYNVHVAWVFVFPFLFTFQILKKHRDKLTGHHSPPPSVVLSCTTDAAGSGGSPNSKETAAQDEAVAARKELAKKQREKAMAQMQNMQRKFLEKNKEHMLDLTAGEDDVYVCIVQCLYYS